MLGDCGPMARQVTDPAKRLPDSRDHRSRRAGAGLYDAPPAVQREQRHPSRSSAARRARCRLLRLCARLTFRRRYWTRQKLAASIYLSSAMPPGGDPRRAAADGYHGGTIPSTFPAHVPIPTYTPHSAAPLMLSSTGNSFDVVQFDPVGSGAPGRVTGAPSTNANEQLESKAASGLTRPLSYGL